MTEFEKRFSGRMPTHSTRKQNKDWYSSLGPLDGHGDLMDGLSTLKLVIDGMTSKKPGRTRGKRPGANSGLPYLDFHGARGNFPPLFKMGLSISEVQDVHGRALNTPPENTSNDFVQLVEAKQVLLFVTRRAYLAEPVTHPGQNKKNGIQQHYKAVPIAYVIVTDPDTEAAYISSLAVSDGCGDRVPSLSEDVKEKRSLYSRKFESKELNFGKIKGFQGIGLATFLVRAAMLYFEMVFQKHGFSEPRSVFLHINTAENERAAEFWKERWSAEEVLEEEEDAQTAANQASKHL